MIIAPIEIILRKAGLSGFELRDLENLREHYVLTLRHGVRNLESQAGCPVKSLTTPPTGRGDCRWQDRRIPLIQGS